MAAKRMEFSSGDSGDQAVTRERGFRPEPTGPGSGAFVKSTFVKSTFVTLPLGVVMSNFPKPAVMVRFLSV